MGLRARASAPSPRTSSEPQSNSSGSYAACARSPLFYPCPPAVAIRAQAVPPLPRLGFPLWNPPSEAPPPKHGIPKGGNPSFSTAKLSECGGASLGGGWRCLRPPGSPSHCSGSRPVHPSPGPQHPVRPQGGLPRNKGGGPHASVSPRHHAPCPLKSLAVQYHHPARLMPSLFTRPPIARRETLLRQAQDRLSRAPIRPPGLPR